MAEEPSNKRGGGKPKVKEGIAKLGKALFGAGLPILAGAIGGPAGSVVAGMLGGLLKKNPDDYDAMAAALQGASPEIITQIRQIEANIALAELETERAEMDAITSRWQADANSKYWLPNNIRPLTLATSLAFWIVWNILSAAIVTWTLKAGSELDEALTGFFVSIGMQISGILGTVIVAYFGARSFDKRIQQS